MARVPDPEAFGGIKKRLANVEDLATDTSRIDGSQYVRALEKIQAILTNLNAQVAAAISANSYTKSQIDSKWSSQDAAINGANSNANGREPAFGVLSPGKGGTNTTNGYNNTFSSGSWKAGWILSDGTLGNAPSSRRFKQDFTPPSITVEQLRAAQWTLFKYIADAEENGDQATWRIGMIAEDLEDAGLSAFVDHDPDGTPAGISYPMLSVAALHLAQQAYTEIDRIKARLDVLEGNS